MPAIKIVLAAALALAAVPALAQTGRPGQRPPPKPPAEQPAAAPAIYPCRTAQEVCFMGIVVGQQLVVLFTNATNAQGIEAKPIDVAGPDGSKLDMSGNNGRVVMLTGQFDARTGLSKGEVVEVASPLASLAIKAQLAGGADEQPAGRAAPRRR